MATTYGPHAYLQKLPQDFAQGLESATKNTGYSSQNPLNQEAPSSRLQFGEMVVSAGKSLVTDIETKGKVAEQATVQAINGEITELQHIDAVKQFEQSVSLGMETIKKMNEAYKDITRMLG